MSGIMLNVVGTTPPAAAGIVYRTDAYASSLKLAVPFDSINESNDIAYLISGTGLSSAATKTQGANSTITTTQVKWTSPAYTKSLENVNTAAVASLTYVLPTGIPSSVSGTFVVEGWFYANNATGNSNWALSSNDSGGRWLFGINNTSAFTFAAENNIGNGSGWHHLAIVSAAGTHKFYYDGIYKGVWVSGNTGFSTLHVGQFNGSDNNDYRGHIQDLRVYVGTAKDYTGTNSVSANFTLPSSIIQSF